MSAYTDALKREAAITGLSDERKKAIAAELRSTKGDEPDVVETADAPAPPETATPPKVRRGK